MLLPRVAGIIPTTDMIASLFSWCLFHGYASVKHAKPEYINTILTNVFTTGRPLKLATIVIPFSDST